MFRYFQKELQTLDKKIIIFPLHQSNYYANPLIYKTDQTKQVNGSVNNMQAKRVANSLSLRIIAT